MCEIKIRAPASSSASARSKVTNGAALFSSDLIDGRSAMSRRFRDVLGAIVGDLGGSDRLSEGQRQLARRCALLAVECEKLEARSVVFGSEYF
jgi:hypothetical protein